MADIEDILDAVAEALQIDKAILISNRAAAAGSGKLPEWLSDALTENPIEE